MRPQTRGALIISAFIVLVATVFYWLGRIDGGAAVMYSREYKMGKQLCDVLDQVDKHMGKSIDDITSIHAQVETGF